MKYEELVRSLFSRLLTVTLPEKKEDKAWNAWLDLEKRETRDLQTLLNSDLRIEFKARALVILWTPALHILPVRWGESSSSLPNYLSLNWAKIEKLPKELVAFAGELTCHNIDYCLASKEEKIRENVYYYNGLIPELLSLLSEDDDLAARLFERFQINDPVSFWNMDAASGYNPFYALFVAEGVPEKWKRLADLQFRERIIAEAERRANPREKWEEAIKCYIRHIESALDSVNVPISIFVSQMEFIVALKGFAEYPINFSNWKVTVILRTLEGDRLFELRHKLARLIVLDESKNSRFKVYDKSSKQAALLMLKEFGTKDQELNERLTFLLSEFSAEQINQANAIKQKREAELTVQNLMK